VEQQKIVFQLRRAETGLTEYGVILTSIFSFILDLLVCSASIFFNTRRLSLSCSSICTARQCMACYNLSQKTSSDCETKHSKYKVGLHST